jgi:hypothetical protein
VVGEGRERWGRITDADIVARTVGEGGSIVEVTVVTTFSDGTVERRTIKGLDWNQESLEAFRRQLHRHVP